ncbi:MAG TPA: type II toxin-antitoxin system prevent-host-death family antitoxin [Cryptosporangiaceae bacterium]|nr:type II toxin-antitoxin system prevent-host-death family antitoxin [Cryptosporangiaceae bacterium]
MPIAEARDHLGDVVDRANQTGQVVYLTRRGRPVAAIVPAADVDQFYAARRAALAESVDNFNAWAAEADFLQALDAEKAAAGGIARA